MNLDPQRIIEFETVIPKCMQALSSVMPGLEIVIRDDLVLSCTKDYPSMDANHAFLLRETPEKIDCLIDEVTSYFKEKELPTAILVSPACTPADLPERLLKRGFIRQEPDEYWLYMEHIQSAAAPRTSPRVIVKPLRKEDAGLFAKTMVAAYAMTPEWAPILADALEPSIGHPNIEHYLAFIDGKPVATMTSMFYEEYVVVGSAGILPEHRGSSLLFNMGVKVLTQARDRGADTILGQTVVGPLFERFLRIYGFKQAFKRQVYILE